MQINTPIGTSAGPRIPPGSAPWLVSRRDGDAGRRGVGILPSFRLFYRLDDPME